MHVFVSTVPGSVSRRLVGRVKDSNPEICEDIVKALPRGSPVFVKEQTPLPGGNEDDN